MANLNEALGQTVVEKSADEFDGGNGRDVLTAGAKDDGVVVDADEASVADGHAMGVTTEIAIHLLGTPERAFGVDDPALVVQARAAAASCPRSVPIRSSGLGT